MLTYRPLQLSDFPGILPFLQICCDEISAPYDPVSITKTFLRGYQSGDLQVICVDDNNTYLGIVCASVQPHYTNFSSLHLCEYAWHSSKPLSPLTRAKIMIQLLQILQDFAKSRHLPIILSVEPDSTLNKYLTKQGFKLKELSYTKGLDDGNIKQNSRRYNRI